MLTKEKIDFIEFMLGADVLRFGDFVTKSGRNTPYFVNTGNYRTGAQISALGKFYASLVKNTIGDEFDAMFGPAYKGIPLVCAAAGALYSEFGIDKPYFFNRKEEKDHGEGGVFVGYKPTAGEEIVIVEDVITAGTAIRESMAILSSLKGAKVAAAFVMVDRCEKGRGESSAMAEVGEEFGFPVYSVVNVYDIIEYLEEDAKNSENVERIKNYLKNYGAKE